jgi:hypothetical protein
MCGVGLLCCEADTAHENCQRARSVYASAATAAAVQFVCAQKENPRFAAVFLSPPVQALTPQPSHTQHHPNQTKTTGFIGSHTTLTLLEQGYSAVIVDDLSNSFPRAYEHMKKLAGDKAGKMKFIEADVGDKDALDAIFQAEK